MIDKMRAYLDGIFAMVPASKEVNDAKEELYASMVERYNDCLLEGMDEQAAYDTVIESIGDIRELFNELGGNSGAARQNDTSDSYYSSWGENRANENSGSSFSASVNEVLQGISDFTSGLVSGLFSTGDPTAASQLVNTQTIALDNISVVDIGYLSESITVLPSEDGQLIIKEYMNRNEPELYARIEMHGCRLSVRNGRRQGVFGLRSYIEVYLPASFNGSLELSTVSGNISTDATWQLASLQARTVSGGINIAGAECAGLLRLSSTSGSVTLGSGSGTIEMHSISGSIKAESITGSGSFKTTSGGVRVDFTKLSGNVEASTVSGGVRLTLPQDAAFELDGRSVSGGIYTAFDSQLTYERRNKVHGFVGRAPFYHLRVASTSGSVHIND